MIFLIHGDNVSKSRDTILQIQQKLKATKGASPLSFGNKISLSLDDTTPAQLTEKAASFDLFAEPPFIVFDISSAGRKTLKEYTEVLAAIPKETNLVIFADKELGKSNDFLKNANKLGVKNLVSSAVPSHNIFKFLDAVYEKRAKQTYTELKNLLVAEEDPIYIFTMLIYGLRNIALTKFDSPLTKSLPPFVKSKVAKQANNFTEPQIKNLYNLGYDCDLKMKSGRGDPNILVIYFIEKVLA